MLPALKDSDANTFDLKQITVITTYVLERKEPSRAALIQALILAISRHEDLDKLSCQACIDKWKPMIGGDSGPQLLGPLHRKLDRLTGEKRRHASPAAKSAPAAAAATSTAAATASAWTFTAPAPSKSKKKQKTTEASAWTAPAPDEAPPPDLSHITTASAPYPATLTNDQFLSNDAPPATIDSALWAWKVSRVLCERPVFFKDMVLIASKKFPGTHVKMYRDMDAQGSYANSNPVVVALPPKGQETKCIAMIAKLIQHHSKDNGGLIQPILIQNGTGLAQASNASAMAEKKRSSTREDPRDRKADRSRSRSRQRDRDRDRDRDRSSSAKVDDYYGGTGRDRDRRKDKDRALRF